MTENEVELVCEALVREIGRAGRWTAVVDAWVALLHVRQMADDMRREEIHLARSAVARGRYWCPKQPPGPVAQGKR